MNRRTKIILAGSAALLAASGVAFGAKSYKAQKEMRGFFKPQKMIERFDKDGDQAISLTELKAVVGERFSKADTDSNQAINKSDITGAIEASALSDRMKSRSDKIANRIIKTLDIDENGSLTAGEVDNRLAKFHALADWNDDGKVEVAELKRLRATMRGRGGKRKQQN